MMSVITMGSHTSGFVIFCANGATTLALFFLCCERNLFDTSVCGYLHFNEERNKSE